MDNRTAIQAVTGTEVKFIAGGTNLVDLMKMHVEQPKTLVNISGLDLSDIQETPGGGLLIGALVRNTDLAYHPAVQSRYAVLSEALLSGASPQLRNMATTGGNVLQRTRCPYFYNTTMPCNKRVPGSGCSAINGYNRSHAILGNSEHCIATHPSDLCVALAALDAKVLVQGKDGERSIAFADFHLLPGTTPQLENSLRTGELITAIEIPAPPAAMASHYLKARDRSSYEFALASAAVMLGMDGTTIRFARIALGGVGTKPWRSPEAEKSLTGQSANTQAFQAAAQAALAGAEPHQFNAFKIELAKRTLVRALETTAGRP